MRALRQLFCVHWFDDQPSYAYEYFAGAVVNCEQKKFEVMVQPRCCSKCGFTETRRLGEPRCLGWSL
jgi:predicted Zn-ribbon and HTH transcriptional regulator